MKKTQPEGERHRKVVPIRLCPEAIRELDRRAEEGGMSRSAVFESMLIGTVTCHDRIPEPLPDCVDCGDPFLDHAWGHGPCIANCTCELKLGEEHTEACKGCRCELYVPPDGTLARLDAAKTAKPKTRLLARVRTSKEGAHGIVAGPATVLEEVATGKRTALHARRKKRGGAR